MDKYFSGKFISLLLTGNKRQYIFIFQPIFSLSRILGENEYTLQADITAMVHHCKCRGGSGGVVV
jgi:hypothetical protein